MRGLFVIVLFLTSLIAVAQVDSVGLKATMQKLDVALLQKNETELQRVLHKDLSYGHSNGWIQSKSDVLNDFKTGKLTYNKIENNSIEVVRINNKWATVKTNTNAEGALNGTTFKLTLHIMQFWLKTKRGWQLIARQSSKIG